MFPVRTRDCFAESAGGGTEVLDEIGEDHGHGEDDGEWNDGGSDDADDPAFAFGARGDTGETAGDDGIEGGFAEDFRGHPDEVAAGKHDYEHECEEEQDEEAAFAIDIEADVGEAEPTAASASAAAAGGGKALLGHVGYHVYGVEGVFGIEVDIGGGDFAGVDIPEPELHEDEEHEVGAGDVEGVAKHDGAHACFPQEAAHEDAAADGSGYNQRHVNTHEVLPSDLLFVLALLCRFHRVTIYGTYHNRSS